MADKDFLETREALDNLIIEIDNWIKKKSILEASRRLEKAQSLLKSLKEIAKSKNEVQSRVIFNRSFELESLFKKIDDILSKREAGKKEDGNIAFKCNWNDKYYKEPCSSSVYNFNIMEGRAWCSSPLSKCREFKGEITLSEHPCYESIALKELYFGAGWDHTGEINKPRHIHSARIGRMALLTTRPPSADEKDRLIIGCLFIQEVQDDPDAETIILGDKGKSIVIDYDNIKVKFWDYYKNEGAEDLILWASGLFRYVSNETVLNILKGIGEQYKNSGKDISKIIGLIKYYEELAKK